MILDLILINMSDELVEAATIPRRFVSFVSGTQDHFSGQTVLVGLAQEVGS